MHDWLKMPAEGKAAGAVVYVLHIDIFSASTDVWLISALSGG